MATSVKLKKINMERARGMLKSMEVHTKNSLSAATGLSVATCGNILKDMLETGEVLEVEQAESTGGRPSRQFIYNKDFSYIITLYIRREMDIKSAYFSVANIIGEIVFEQMKEYGEINVDTIDGIVAELIEKYPQTKVFTIGVPGVVRDGYIGICDFNTLKDFDIKKHYEHKYDFETVGVNDVNCISYGYYKRNCFSESQNLVYIYYPTHDGPGAGIIVEGSVLVGQTHFAGEVSYLPHLMFNDKSADVHFDVSPFEEDVFKTMMAANVLINPKRIVLSGFKFTEEIIYNVKKLAQAYIPSSHVPEICFEEDIHESYRMGLISIALDKLAYKYKI